MYSLALNEARFRSFMSSKCQFESMMIVCLKVYINTICNNKVVLFNSIFKKKKKKEFTKMLKPI